MDDHSSDDTWMVLEKIAPKYHHLRIFKASDEIATKHGKKYALREAMGKARYDYVLLTDADCRPAGKEWIMQMASRFSEGKQIVLGLGLYNRSNGWLNQLIQYETFFTALSYLGFALAGKPYMGVGRNLAYKRSLFESGDGFEDHKDLASGDDDLFVQHKANAQNTIVCIDPAARTYSDPPMDFKSWLHQKSRHYSTFGRYHQEIIVRLFFWKASIYGFNLAVLLLLLSGHHVVSIVSIFVMRTVIWYFLLNRVGCRLGYRHTLYLLPCLEICFALIDVWILLRNKVIKKFRWK
jgi:cellulose synthase/poly-beta-1,6-N-acetylglucosamine synthase-like glycosyltransferase